MPPDQAASPDYFDTPARAERLQLLLHLARNATEAIYLRAPAGAGKTRFARRLIDHLDDEATAVWLDADQTLALPAFVSAELGLPAAAGEWPNAVLQTMGERELLLVVDDADRLDPFAVQELIALQAAGVRPLLLGEGTLAQPDGAWGVQFVDLPGFDAAQSAAFLRLQAGTNAARITDDLAAAAHSASNGLPGPLLEALRGVLARPDALPPRGSAQPRPVAEPPPQADRGKSLWVWIGGGLIVAILALLLVFQDRVNALFEPPAVVQIPEESALEPPDQALDEPPVAPLAPQTIDAAVEPGATGLAAAVDPPAGSMAEPIRELQQAGAGGVPPIALPQLSRPPSVSGDQALPPGAQTVVAEPPLPGVADIAGEAARASGDAPAETAGPDALDAVMQDAMGAAATQSMAGTQRDAVVAEVAKDANPVEIKAAVAEAASPARAGTPAPVEERTSSRPANKPVAVPLATARSAGERWLATRNPAHFTLQLVGARERSSVEKFVRVHAIASPYAVSSRDLKGKPWYSLVAGDYPTRDAAIAARDRLPKALQGAGVWPRTFESVVKTK